MSRVILLVATVLLIVIAAARTAVSMDLGGRLECLGSAPSCPDFWIIRNAAVSNDLTMDLDSLQIAVWRDGTIVFPALWHEPGKNLRVVTVGPERIQKFFAVLEEARLREDSIMLDRLGNFPETQIRFRDAKSGQLNMIRWTELITPYVPEAKRMTPQYVAFAKMWTHVKIATCELFPGPGAGKPLKEAADASGHFRGIDPLRPGATPWIQNEVSAIPK